jgi:hypothetical protein
MKRKFFIAAIVAGILPVAAVADSTSSNLAATRIAIACPSVTHVVVDDANRIIIWSNAQDDAEARVCAQSVDLHDNIVNMDGFTEAHTVRYENGLIVLE